MTRLISATFLALWFALLAVAPAMGVIRHSDNRLQASEARACYASVKPQSHLTAKPVPAKVTHKANPWSQRQVAYVSQWTNDDKRSVKILKAAHKVAVATGTNPRLILAAIKSESGFDPKARGRGYHGLMQVKSSAHRKRMQRLDVTNIYDIEQNIRLGTDILVEYKKSAKGNLKKALVRYTGGSRRTANQIIRDMQSIPT